MTDKAKIKAEIERLKAHYYTCGYVGQGEYENGNKQGRLDTCDAILSFIDSLPEEPVNKVWHKGDEFKGVKYMRKHGWVIGNMENKRFAVGPWFEVEDGGIDILDGGGGIEMVLREEDSWAYLEDLLRKTLIEE